MLTRLLHAVAAALLMVFATPAFADGPGDAGPDVAAPPVRAAPVAPATNAPAPQGRTGVIPLNNGEVSLNVPSGYLFYPASEAYAFLQRASATAPGGTVLGLVAPANTNIRAPGAWATVVSYDAIGYVPPETAAGLSDTGFEDSVRGARADQGRAFEGFAADPAFDTTYARLTWAERAAPPASQAADLRYEQKLLGRYGVAGLTSVGSADQMPEITAAASTLIGMLSFPEGRQQADFDPANDQVSDFTVPGLVTGVAEAVEQDAAPTDGGQTAFGGLAGYFPWIALGVVVLAGAGYMLMRRRKDDDVEELTDA